MQAQLRKLSIFVVLSCNMTVRGTFTTSYVITHVGLPVAVAYLCYNTCNSSKKYSIKSRPGGNKITKESSDSENIEQWKETYETPSTTIPQALAMATITSWLGAQIMKSVSQDSSQSSSYHYEPQVTFDDLIMTSSEVQQLKNRLEHHQAFINQGYRAFPNIVMLHGKPGTGKSATAEAIARYRNNRGGVTLKLDGASVQSRWAGAGAQKIEHFFNVARQEALKGIPVTLIMNEIESITRKRNALSDIDSASADHNQTVGKLLTEFESLETDGLDIVLIGTTNHYHTFEDALKRPGRTNASIELHHMNEQQRKRALHLYAHKQGLPSHITFADIAKKSAGMSSDYFKKIPELAIERRVLEAEAKGLHARDLVQQYDVDYAFKKMLSKFKKDNEISQEEQDIKNGKMYAQTEQHMKVIQWVYFAGNVLKDLGGAAGNFCTWIWD